jgi:hypothetical protein
LVLNSPSCYSKVPLVIKTAFGGLMGTRHILVTSVSHLKRCCLASNIEDGEIQDAASVQVHASYQSLACAHWPLFHILHKQAAPYFITGRGLLITIDQLMYHSHSGSGRNRTSKGRCICSSHGKAWAQSTRLSKIIKCQTATTILKE